MTVLSVIDTLTRVRSSVISDLMPSMMSVSSGVAAIMASISLVKVFLDNVSGRKSLFHSLVRPLVILSLVCQFQTLVSSPLDALSSAVTRSLESSLESSVGNYVKRWSCASAKMSELSRKSTEEQFRKDLVSIAQKKGLQKELAIVSATVRRAVTKRLDIAACGVGSIAAGFLLILSEVILFAQQIISSILLCCLTLVGPLVFAIGVFPGFSGGIGEWVSRYLQTSLWIPVGMLVMQVNLSIGDAFVDISSAEGTSLSLQWMMIVVQTCNMICILMVPKLCNLIVDQEKMSSLYEGVKGSILHPKQALQ